MKSFGFISGLLKIILNALGKIFGPKFNSRTLGWAGYPRQPYIQLNRTKSYPTSGPTPILSSFTRPKGHLGSSSEFYGRFWDALGSSRSSQIALAGQESHLERNLADVGALGGRANDIAPSLDIQEESFKMPFVMRPQNRDLPNGVRVMGWRKR